MVGCLIGLARATEGNDHLLTEDTAGVVRDALAGRGDTPTLLGRIDREKRRLVPMCYDCASPCGRTNAYDLRKLERQPEGLRSLRLRILALLQERADRIPPQLLYRGLYAIGMEDWEEAELNAVLLDISHCKL